MAEELPSPKLKFESDVSKLTEALRTGELSIGKFKESIKGLATGQDAAERSQERYERSIAKLANELKGNGATAELHKLEAAIKEAGGAQSFTAIQTENLSRKIEALKAAGGTVPASMAGLTASTSQLGKTIETQALQQVQGLTSHLGPMGSALSSMGPYGMAAAAGIAALALAGGAVTKVLADSVKEAVDYAGRLSDISAKSAIAVESQQRLEYAGKLVGVSLESINSSAVKLQKALVESPEKFDRLGLSAEKLRSMAPEDQLAAVAEALQKIEDPAIRNAMAMELMGKSAAEVMPFLRSEFKEAAERAGELGLVMSGSTVQALDAVGDAATTLNETWAGLWRNIGAAIAKAPDVAIGIDSVADSLGHFSKRIQDNEAQFRPWAKMVSEFLGSSANWTIGFADTALFGDTPEKPRGITGSGEVPRTAFKTDAQAKKELAEANAAKQEAIRLEKELATAYGASRVGLDAVIAKIHAEADAERQQIILKAEGNKAYAAQKEAMLASIAATEGVNIANARSAAAKAADKIATQENAAAMRLHNETITASMSALDVAIHKIEAKKLAEIAAAEATLKEAQANRLATAAVYASVASRMAEAHAYAANAIVREKANAARQVEASSIALVDKAEREYASAIARTQPGLKTQIASINAKRDADIHAAQAAFEGGKITEEALRRALVLYNLTAEAAIKLAKASALVKTIGDIGNAVSGVSDILTEFGMKADSELGKTFRDLEGMLTHGANALQAFAKGDLVTAGIEGIKTLIDTVKSGIDIKNLFSSSDSERALELVGRDWGTTISEELAKKIGEDAKRYGEVAAAGVNIAAIIKEAGGIDEFGVDNAIKHTQDLFSELERGNLTVQAVGTAFDSVFGDIASRAIDKSTGRLQANARELVALARANGVHSEELDKLMTSQGQVALAGLTAFLKGSSVASEKTEEVVRSINNHTAAQMRLAQAEYEAGTISREVLDERLARLKLIGEGEAKAAETTAAATITTQAAATAIGSSIAAIFAELKASGMSTADAMKAIQPAAEALRAQLKITGLNGGAAFAALDAQLALVTGTVTGPMLAGILGLGDAMVALDNMNLLTAESFSALASEAVNAYHKMVKEGADGKVALAAMQPTLQRIWEMQQDYGYEVDESTQALLNQGVAAGIVGDEHRSAQDIMARAMVETAEAVQALARHFGALREEIGKVPRKVNIDVSTTTTTTGNTPPPPDPDPPTPPDPPDGASRSAYVSGRASSFAIPTMGAIGASMSTPSVISTPRSSTDAAGGGGGPRTLQPVTLVVAGRAFGQVVADVTRSGVTR